MRLSPCVLVQPDGWAREGYGGPCDVTSLSLSLSLIHARTPSKRAKDEDIT